MAPTPPNTTARMKVHYNCPGGSHKMLFHKVASATDAAFQESVAVVTIAMAFLLYTGGSFDAAEFAEAGSPFFNPAAWEAVPATSGVTFTAASNSASNFLQWGGRSSSSGKRVKLYLLQPLDLDNSRMRFLTGENARMDGVITALIGENTQIGNIAGEAVVWQLYTNCGENDHLTHRARG